MGLKTRVAGVFIVAALIVTAIGCGGTAGTMNTVGDKTYNLIESRNFEIENQWAYPLRGSQVNLLGNPNYIRVKGDSVKLFLPYFGERQMGGGYNSENGIKYEGPLKNLRISNSNSKYTEMDFRATQGSESLDFSVKIYPGGKTDTEVNTSERDNISYRGNIKELPENIHF